MCRLDKDLVYIIVFNAIGTIFNLCKFNTRMKRNSVHFIVAITLPFPLFSPSKKERHRIKRERQVLATKKMHGVPFHLILRLGTSICTFVFVDESERVINLLCCPVLSNFSVFFLIFLEGRKK